MHTNTENYSNYHGEQDVTDILSNSIFNFLQLNNNALLSKGYFGLLTIIIVIVNKPIIICLKAKTVIILDFYF